MTNEIRKDNYNSLPKNYRGLSTDVKPINVPNGSIYLERDTGKVWEYDYCNINPVTLNGWWEV